MTEYQRITKEMKKYRSTKHWNKKDIERIKQARESDDWTDVYKSELYKKYSGEFCSLFEVLHRLNKEGAVI